MGAAAGLSVTLADGWSCIGTAHDLGAGTITATCTGTDGSTIEVELSGLHHTGQGIGGKLSIVV